MTRRVALAGGLLAVLCGVIVAAGMLGAPKPIAMACSEVKALTAKFVSGTLDDERTAGVRAHLASCPHCDAHMKNAKEAFERQSEITVASR